MALAWVIRNNDVSTALFGAKTKKQLDENLVAVEVLDRFTKEIDEKIEKILANRPSTARNFVSYENRPNRR